MQDDNGFSTAYPAHIDFDSDCCGFFYPTKGYLLCNECGTDIKAVINKTMKERK